jgi:hypothetical protein
MTMQPQNDPVVLARTAAGQRVAVWGWPLPNEAHLDVLLLVNGYTPLGVLAGFVEHADDVGEAVRSLQELGLITSVDTTAPSWPLWRSQASPGDPERRARK